jgi:hypothetical protein
MGVGYQVSPLHRLIYMDMSAMHERPIVKGEDPRLDRLAALTGAKTLSTGTGPFYSPAVGTILAWRQRLADKYREQLQGGLTWDEGSDFEDSADVGTSADVWLRYVAAVLDRRGPVEFRRLADRPGPSQEQKDAVLTAAFQRGFGGRFPQLLSGAGTWLPFEENLMLEEPDWRGQSGRYGSIARFADEVSAVRAAIAAADPTAASVAGREAVPRQMLPAAWQAATAIQRLAVLATQRQLPLHTTG